MTSAPDACPLCGFRVLVPTKTVPTSPLQQYWANLGYDLSAHHKNFPATFSVFTCVQCGLGTYAPQAIGGSNLYEKLGVQEFYYPSTRWDHQTALGFLHQRGVKSLFEFGCGSGQFLNFASRLVSEAVGVDFNGDAVAQARKQDLNVFENWDYGSNAKRFEAVATFQTLEHLPNPGAVVGQLVKLLEPNGYLIVAVPNEDGPLGQLTVNPLNAPPHHASLWPRSALEYIGTAHGLTLEVYAREPINRALYFTLVEESFRASLSGTGRIAKFARRILRWKVHADAALAFAEKRFLLDGHNHIAIFRKASS